ncbi:MAG: lytic transglycosylase domain-containing protein [Armatimonadetes bacterium]|nr:lytic transglycosylase domain-containing protein [Armatimonadota bacterium]
MEVVALTSAWDLSAMEKRERMSKQAQLAYNNAVKTAKRGRSGAARPQPKALSSRSVSAPSYSSSTANALSQTASAAFPAYKAFIQSCNRRLTDAQASDITWAVLRYSEALDTDPRLVVALIIAESDFDNNSVSRSGARGLGQLMPGTARDISARTGLTNPYDPVQNVAGSIWLLRSHLDKYSGGKAMGDISTKHIGLALAAYNAGPGAVKKYGGIPPYRETQNYVKKINRIYRELCGIPE